MDINNDGYLDILSGGYSPGNIYLFKGSEKGFLPHVLVEQEGFGTKFNPKRGPWEPANSTYWTYSAVGFEDFNNDGLIDLFVGGYGGLRVALNVGTASEPKFGLRQYMYHVNGEILHTNRPTDEQIAQQRAKLEYPYMSGNGHGQMSPIDWDGDGVLDLLVTTEYTEANQEALYFFRGVNTDKGLRFEEAVPFMTSEDGTKLMPGCEPHIAVVDYNNDGVKDILYGISIPTVNGYEIATDILYRYNAEMDIHSPGKDVGRSLKFYGSLDSLQTIIDSGEKPWLRDKFIGNFDDIKYASLRHRGYVFLLEGNKKKGKAKAKTVIAQEAEPNISIEFNNSDENSDGVVSYEIVSPIKVSFLDSLSITVKFTIPDKNYFYANNDENKGLGNIPTTVEVSLVEEDSNIVFTKKIIPVEKVYKGNSVYKGDDLVFTQYFKFLDSRAVYDTYNRENPIRFNVKINYQTCNSTSCFPPEEVNKVVEVRL